jgi:poly(hydroxyalkanoate) depolymerase family esterase
MNNAGGQWNYDGFAAIRAAMDSVGFIMILPQQSRNCWNVGKAESLTHDGGGDTGAIIQMVKYALEKYNGDPTRVYVMGGSGGGMCTQALLATYPEIFKAGSERAGVAAGCWMDSYNDGEQWSLPCAQGQVDKTAQEWGDFVRDINPDYAGPRPRVQMMHGTADQTININNLRESVEQWGNVLGLEEMPTSNDGDFPGNAKVCNEGGCPSPVTYERRFWQDSCGYTVMEAWEATGQKHGMGYEAEAILKFFGLDQQHDQDPWDEACAGMTPPAGSTPAGTGGGGSTDPMGTAGAGGTEGAGASTNTPDPTPSGSDTPAASTPVGASTPAPMMEPPPVATPPVAMPTPPVATPPATGTTTTPPTATTTTPTTTAAPTLTPGAPVASMGAPMASGALAPQSDTSDDSGGCNVANRTTGTVAPLALIAFGLLLGRRRRAA